MYLFQFLKVLVENGKSYIQEDLSPASIENTRTFVVTWRRFRQTV